MVPSFRNLTITPSATMMVRIHQVADRATGGTASAG
jgi:hypothetical protein